MQELVLLQMEMWNAGEQVPTRAFHNEDRNPPKSSTASLVHKLLNELILPKMLPGAAMLNYLRARGDYQVTDILYWGAYFSL